MGVWDVLYENDISIARVCGTSGGSIIASLIAIYGGRLEPFLSQIRLGDVLDRNWWFWNGYSLYKGKKFKKKLRDLFGEVRLRHVPNLYIIATRITSQPGPVVFNARYYPDVPVYKAVLASCSAPFIFRPVDIYKQLFIDGGVSINFAVDLFEDEPRPTLGVLIQGESELKPFRGGLIDYVRTIFNIMFDSLEKEHIDDAKWARILRVKTPISAFDFDIGMEDIIALYNLGRKTASKIVHK